MNVPTGRRKVRLFLQRFGSKAEIYKPTESKTALNHVEDTWEKVSTEYVLREFKDEKDDEGNFESGRRVMSRPTLYFEIDTAVENDWHILYGVDEQETIEYEVTAIMNRGHYTRANGKRRENGTLLGG